MTVKQLKKILIICFLLICAGCTEINIWELKKGELYCQNKGGINRFYLDLIEWVAMCQDGSVAHMSEIK